MPPQQEITGQTNPSYGGANVETEKPHTSIVWWFLILIVVLAMLWIWISWLYGWFPFSSQVTTTLEETTQRIPQTTLDSFTAPTDVPMNDIPQSVLDSFTAPTDSPSVLDSNTP